VLLLTIPLPVTVLLVLLPKPEVTHGAINTPSITRTSSFTYNSDGLLKSETIAPNTDKSLTTTYEYDSFGNKTSNRKATNITILINI
jgi:hypothetical protein